MSSVAMRAACNVCGGSGLVTVDVWLRWREHQAARRTSSTTPIRVALEATIVRLRARQTAQTAPLVTVGSCLLESIDEWEKQALAPTGEERARVYRRVSDWMTAADSVLNRDR